MKHITYPDTNECRHALKHMKEGSCIINSTSVNAYNGNPEALDYTATKGAIVAFTRGLSQQLASRGIRVNGVAPGPVLYAFYINNSVQLCLHIFGLACRWDGRQRLSYSVPSPISY